MWTNGMEIALLSHRRVWAGQHIDRLIDQASEEAAEIIVAVQHVRRGRVSSVDAIGEFADLWLCMEFIRRSIGLSDAEFKSMLDARTQRLQITLDNLENASGLAPETAPASSPNTPVEAKAGERTNQAVEEGE